MSARFKAERVRSSEGFARVEPMADPGAIARASMSERGAVRRSGISPEITPNRAAYKALIRPRQPSMSPARLALSTAVGPPPCATTALVTLLRERRLEDGLDVVGELNGVGQQQAHLPHQFAGNRLLKRGHSGQPDAV